ncbi:PAS domain S-box-containing protein/diguanylate cyclase (GGDEF) domain-containing protein [Marinobacter daqiaonensis]|uniref:PAS domain S-box-containing protein/diguanylate cyclase (GGDEF) domain-containing protein n=1 Tax=Marinobacter daqiaonensis TaxID=650891 RepID=A0A1I6IHC0_9GAMM|nr:diguanylate cyclase [Marinobacter daqiaonensis]SFR66078.1 PAS domain S-box-containing protein/diguanylate cyclase (GGDEF) domain-containing protein [Marinobacter daqiaonensis]
MEKTGGRGTPSRRALWIALAYLIASSLWILLTDLGVERLVRDPVALTQVQTWKGWAFVAVTAAVLYLVLRRQFQRDRELLDLQQDQREEILRLSQFQESVIDNANIWINVLDQNGRILLWNKAAEKISGYPGQEVTGGDWIWQALYPDPDYRNWVLAQVDGIHLGGKEVEGLETTILTRDGNERLIAWNSRPFRNTGGEEVGSIAIGMDVTERRAAERRLMERERQLTTIMDNLPGMAYRCLYDDRWTMKFVSSGCHELTGYQPEDLIDNHRIAWTDIILPEHRPDVLEAVEQAIASADSFSLEYEILRADGERLWVWERGRSIEENSGLALEGIVLDITERKELEQRLSELATLDALTGQLNRRETERLLEEEVIRANRYQRQLAVLWVDLDHFKDVNDTHGHAVGDQVLRAVSLRLADSIRAVDTLGRFGGEEFIVVLPEMSVMEAEEIAERLRHRVADEPILTTSGEPLALTISIGVAVFPDHATTAEGLCELADRAMYRAKEEGRNRTAIATPGV